MKILHILKTEPDKKTSSLIASMSQGEESTVFEMYGEKVDYQKLLDLIFENDKIVSWW